jgi:predicted nucleic acid-binding protein
MNSLDTNILVYAVSELNGEKERIAKSLVDQASNESWPIAAQVYGEFFSVMVRRKYMTRQEANIAVEAFSAVMPPVVSSLAAHAAALKLATARQMQYWDALIIATCAERGVKQLYTEDIPGLAKPLGVRCTSPW